MANSTISLVIPVHNGGIPFRTCLDAVRRLDPPPHETIIVADGDTDGSRDLAAAAGLRVIARPTAGGPAVARNRGAQAASGEILLFIDADIVVPPQLVAEVGAVFAANPELAALIGSYDDRPAAPNFLSQYRNLLHHYVHQTGAETASTFWGACGAIRRADFLALGGFDERYARPSIEDIELGYRLVRGGRQIRLCKAIQVTHLKRWTAGSILRTDVFGRAIPWTLLILRDGRMVNDLNLRISSRVSVLCSGALLALAALSPWQRAARALALACAATLLVLNAPLYGFFARTRGVGFALRAIPWHWLYYLYSGVSFAIGAAMFRIEKRRRPGERSASTPE